MLVLDRLEARVAGKKVLGDVSLEAASPGVLFIVGPGRAGKSTLLSALSQQVEMVSFAGNATIDGRSIRLLSNTCHVPQNIAGEHDAMRAGALDISRRRKAAVLSALEVDAPLYLVDEPTAGLLPEEVMIVRERLRQLAQGSCVVVATHNRQDCLDLGGRTALLAGGSMQECRDTQGFFSEPRTDAGRTYVETGNCGVLASRSDPPPGAEGIWWLVPGLLAGLSRPGLVADVRDQARYLRTSGVSVMVGLEESIPESAAAVREAGIEYLHFPVADMTPPTFQQAVSLCRMLETRVRDNRGVAFHCRGGLGRTGTVLAALMIWFGDDAVAAIASVRAAKPLAIQTVSQTLFLRDFSDRIRGWHVRTNRSNTA